jgi:phosphate transport system protein
MPAKDHIFKRFDEELTELAGQIAEMGGMAEKMVADSILALVRMDTVLAQKIIGSDGRVDRLEKEVEEKAVLMIAQRQPMANDLREIMAAMKISADLERVGDLAKNISKRVIAINSPFAAKKLVIGVEHLSEIALDQLKNVLDAYSARDAAGAAAVRQRDDEIDALYTSLFRELLTYMMEDPRNITFCTHLLFVAKNIERIGDHATNIAETVQYLVTGEQPTDNRPKSDMSSLTNVEFKGDK